MPVIQKKTLKQNSTPFCDRKLQLDPDICSVGGVYLDKIPILMFFSHIADGFANISHMFWGQLCKIAVIVIFLQKMQAYSAKHPI
jgi:hypothetical protein